MEYENISKLITRFYSIIIRIYVNDSSINNCIFILGKRFNLSIKSDINVEFLLELLKCQLQSQRNLISYK